jgi:hypothetical protein
VSRLARWALSFGLLGAALLAGHIGGGDVLSAVTGNEQDSPDVVLIVVGAGFLLAAVLLAEVALISADVHARAPLAILVPLAGVPWWDALGLLGVLLNAALLIAVVALASGGTVPARPSGR